MKIRQKSLIIGPDSQGGITSVINSYFQNGLNDAEFLPSYINGSKFKQICYYFIFLNKYILKLLNSDFKVIHIHSASRGSFLRKFIAFYLAKCFCKKTIFHLHGAEFNLFYEQSPLCIKYFIQNLLNKSDVIIALSEQWKEDLLEKTINKNIKVLYNPTILKKNIIRNSKSIKVLFMGRLGKRKGAYDIIEAAKYLKNKNIEILLYGDGEIKQIKALILQNNLEDTVKIGGWILGQDVENAYRNADIFILPSYNEGLPMSVLEALSFGLPIISTPVGGTPDAVQEGVNGYLVQPGDYKSLCERIELLASNKELRKQMGKESYKIAEMKFDINIIISELKNIYEELIV